MFQVKINPWRNSNVASVHNIVKLCSCLCGPLSMMVVMLGFIAPIITRSAQHESTHDRRELCKYDTNITIKSVRTCESDIGKYTQCSLFAPGCAAFSKILLISDNSANELSLHQDPTWLMTPYKNAFNHQSSWHAGSISCRPKL